MIPNFQDCNCSKSTIFNVGSCSHSSTHHVQHLLEDHLIQKTSGKIDYNITTLKNLKSTYRLQEKKRNPPKCLQISQSFITQREASSHPFHKRRHPSSWLRLSGSSGAPFSKSDLERAVGRCLEAPKKKLGICWYVLVWYGKISFWYFINSKCW